MTIYHTFHTSQYHDDLSCPPLDKWVLSDHPEDDPTGPVIAGVWEYKI